MASEIRVNTINNSSGLGTITISDTGAVFAGVTTITNLQVNGTTTGVVMTGVTTVSTGSTSAPSITPSGDTNTGIFFPSADTIAFAEGGAEAARIDSSGRLLVGTSSSRTTWKGDGVNNYVQIEYAGSAYGPGLTLYGNSATTTRSPILTLGKSGGTTVGSFTIAPANEPIGRIHFEGADGTQSVAAATIEAYVDGTPGANDMPGRLVFSTTADGASSPTERMRLDSSGRLGIGDTTPDNKLVVRDTGDVYIKVAKTGQNGTYVGSENALGLIASDNALSLRVGGQTSASERARIDSSGRLLVGTSSAISTGLNNNGSSYQDAESRLQVASTSWNQASVSLTTYQGNAAGVFAQIGINRSKSDTLGTVGSALANGDVLGGITFSGSDGSKFVPGAWITAVADGTFSNNDAPGRLVFSTTADGASSPTERMRIANDGAVFVAKTGYATGTAGIELQPTGSVYATRDNNLCALFNRLSSDGTLILFQRSTTSVGSITVTSSSTAYNTSSDYRLKENIVPLTGATARINQLQVHRFNFIADSSKTVDGFLAHEAQAVVPECVTGTKDEVDDDGNPIYQGIDQSKLVPLLTAALQEALAEIESLKARVTALEP